ncbi:MAG: molybdopterin-binding/glycosyltransferase family 2 protein, partial [Alphaproteobacteria bacterium]|nr:molybdopterin-binding/glycosyltransferase family 2 protein [Alphaproteobacteria bacterium]
MKFGETPVSEAEGGILAHSVRAASVTFRKGRVLARADVEALAAAGIRSVIVAFLERDDIGENEAASRLAGALAGDGVSVAAAFTGRANLFARHAGLLRVDVAKIEAFNRIDEAITVATLQPWARVWPRQMLATIKIIPFAAPRASTEKVEALMRARASALHIAPFRAMTAALISTELPGTKTSVLDKSRRSLDERLGAIGSTIGSERRVPHEKAAVARAIRDASGESADLILLFGASAITDRRDVIPAAIVEAGGTIEHFGMPVDPGNLLLLGSLDGRTVIGLPSCARSPKLNGVDFVLWRIAAGCPVGRNEIAAMGVGGLLGEIPTRPQPREEPPVEMPRQPRIAAVILAAGTASRLGGSKLLEPIGSKPLIAYCAEAASRSGADPVIVVTGNRAQALGDAVSGLPVTLVNNPDYSTGLASSLRMGLEATPADCDGALILLADMPAVSTELIDRLIAAFDPDAGRAICVPVRGGRRGNPVLWARRFFPEMRALEGDVGARKLLAQYEESVCEIEVADDGPFLDIDTP